MRLEDIQIGEKYTYVAPKEIVTDNVHPTVTVKELTKTRCRVLFHMAGEGGGRRGTENRQSALAVPSERAFLRMA